MNISSSNDSLNKTTHSKIPLTGKKGFLILQDDASPEKLESKEGVMFYITINRFICSCNSYQRKRRMAR